MLRKALIAAVFVMPAIAVPASAQQSTVKRSPLQTVDFPAGHNVISAIAEISPGCVGRHTHPGVESTYVMEGSLVLKVEGQPDKTYKAGESFQVPPYARHDACAVDGPFKILVSYIVEKGKPVATPAP